MLKFNNSIKSYKELEPTGLEMDVAIVMKKLI